jgi:hypothetical protein
LVERNRLCPHPPFPNQQCLLGRILMISRIAWSRRETARDSYRPSLVSSGSALRMASAVRSSVWFGLVANWSTGSGIAGGLPRGALPSEANSRYREALLTEDISWGRSSASSAQILLIKATLTCRTRARSSAASAAVRACSPRLEARRYLGDSS